eukprot:361291-Chlamydomonas_euryale.AAC.8
MSIEAVLIDGNEKAADLVQRLGCRLCFSSSQIMFKRPIRDMSHHVSAWLSELKVGLDQRAIVMVDADSPPHLKRRLQHELMGWYAQMRLRVVFVSASGTPSRWVRRYWPIACHPPDHTLVEGCKTQKSKSIEELDALDMRCLA